MRSFPISLINLGKVTLVTNNSQSGKTQSDMAAKALKLKQEGEQPRDYLEHQSPSPGDGPIAALNVDEPVSGAFDAEGQRPVLERSRKVR